MQKVIVLASGGVDSTTLLWYYAKIVGTENVTALSVAYGQKHSKELSQIKMIVERLGCGYREIDLGDVFAESKSKLMADSTAPLDQRTYEQQAAESSVISTNVELRNLVFVSAAASCAMQIGVDTVAIGVHASDFAYPDCSPDFVEALSLAIATGSAQRVHLTTPLLHMDKAEVIKTGMPLGVPYELTWSCYAGHEKPCGMCASCLDRERAFRAAGYTDPALKNSEKII